MGLRKKGESSCCCSWIRGHIVNSLWLVPWLHHASLHGIVMDISFMHLSFVISMYCICISHRILIHLHLACFCSANCMHSISTVHMNDPCIFLFKKKNKTKPTDKSKSNNLKPSIGSTKKLKRKSIGGLAKVNFSTAL